MLFQLFVFFVVFFVVFVFLCLVFFFFGGGGSMFCSRFYFLLLSVLSSFLQSSWRGRESRVGAVCLATLIVILVTCDLSEFCDSSPFLHYVIVVFLIMQQLTC